MKKYIQSKIEELKYLYPGETIAVENGFIGISTPERLKHTSYIGNAYFEVDGILYTDYNGSNKSKKLLTLN